MTLTRMRAWADLWQRARDRYSWLCIDGLDWAASTSMADLRTRWIVEAMTHRSRANAANAKYREARQRIEALEAEFSPEYPHRMS